VNENNRNMILAIVLSALVLFGWSAISARFLPQPKPAPVAASAPSAAQVATPSATAKQRDLKLVLGESARVAIDTPRLKGSINLTGARIDDLVLPTYAQTLAKGSPPVQLFSPAGTKQSYFAGFGWSGDGLTAPGPATIWTADRNVLTPEKPVTLSWANGVGQSFAIRIAVDKDFLFTVTQSVSNAGAAPVAVRSYGYVSRDHVSADISSWTNHLGPIGVIDGAALYDVDYTNLAGDEPGFFSKMFGTKAVAGENKYATTGGWLGFGDKYWLAAIVPPHDAKLDAAFRAEAGNYQAQYALTAVTVAPGKILSSTARLFAGAKEVELLDQYADQGGIHMLGKAIDWGWFEIIAKPFFKLLHWLFNLTGNFGVAIILMTFIVRGCMFPVAQRQFASMAAMKAIQPKMKAIQERFKDDKLKQQQEVMALYKAEKVNPMAGCLPIFLQAPVFYALYKVLILTIEMRHQPFAAWLKDLSAPDPMTPITLFGLVPWPAPEFLMIGVLPILLGVTMYLQFKLNPQQGDPAQQQVFAIMPWVFMFIMGRFASGLQLYWTVSNILTIAQQKWLYSKHPALKAAPAT
jgi:YidC/Oxa1 family membrane protein insertase